MKEIDDTKGASHQRKDLMASNIDLRACSRVGKDVSEAQLAKREFGIIGMGAEIFQTV